MNVHVLGQRGGGELGVEFFGFLVGGLGLALGFLWGVGDAAGEKD